MWALPPEATDDYDIWITIGQSLHALDESLLDEWDKWSKQSDKYRKGECQKRWLGFDKGGARTLGSLLHIAKQHGWKPSQDWRQEGIPEAELDRQTNELKSSYETPMPTHNKKKLRARPCLLLWLMHLYQYLEEEIKNQRIHHQISSPRYFYKLIREI